MKRPDLNRLRNSFWPKVALLLVVSNMLGNIVSIEHSNALCSEPGPACAASADDLFSKKSLFDRDDLFNDNEVKKNEEAQASKAKVEAVNKVIRQHELMTSMAINDGQMFDQMRQVANWVDNWIVWNHRFPEIGDETTYALQQLNELIPNNPYIAGSAYMVSGQTVDNAYLNQEGEQPTPPMADSKIDNDRIVFVRDFGLTVLEIDQYSVDPPVDWRAKPGTITVITNDQYLFIVWGAGADGKPLRDLSSKRVRFAVGNYQRWDAPVMDNQVD
ncbi:hypothetical protein KBI23_11525 [bacterium]|nr:hypothetical protein [bacterium]MBP9809656.1 hypothetical protein [bacterium]